MVKVFQKGIKVLTDELPICDLFNMENIEEEDLEDEVLEDLFSSTQWKNNHAVAEVSDGLEEVVEVNPVEDINNNVSHLDDSIVDFVF